MWRAVYRVDVHRRVHRRDLRAVLQVQGDGLVVKLGGEVAPPVPLQPRRVEGVEQGVEHGEGHRAYMLEGGRTDLLANGPERFLRFLQGAGVAPDDAAHRFTVQMLRKRGSRRHDQEGEEAVHVLRGLGDEFPVPAHDLFGPVELPEHRPGVDGAYGVPPEQEGGYYAEVAPSAPYSPEEVLVFLFAGLDEATIGQDHVGFEQVVDGKAELTAEVAVAAAQGEPADSRGGDDAGGHG